MYIPIYSSFMGNMLFFAYFCIMLIFILSKNTIISNVEAREHPFKISVNLNHVGRGSSKICVSSYAQNLGCRIIQLDNEKNPLRSKWQFESGAVQVGDKFTVCVTNLQISTTTCLTGENTSHNGLEDLTLDFPVSKSRTNAFDVKDSIDHFYNPGTTLNSLQQITKGIPSEITKGITSVPASISQFFPIFITVTIIIVIAIVIKKRKSRSRRTNLTVQQGIHTNPQPHHVIGKIPPSGVTSPPSPNPIKLQPVIGKIPPSGVTNPHQISTQRQVVKDWPTLLVYQEEIQYPTNCFMDSDLKFATFKQGKDKFPLAISGNFASVYQATTRQGQHKAVRCFQRPPINLAERYEQISMYLSTLSTNKPSSLVEFKYIENGIRIKRARFYPIVKMDWVEGDPLNIFVKKHLRDKKILLDLINKFLVAVKQLKRSNIAHGDLQHGNIKITPRFELKLIDYDGMYIPHFKGKFSNEKGHSNYQHPLRDASQFDENLDNFSEMIIYLSLHAVMINANLFEKYNDLDNLIFVTTDFLNPSNSSLMNSLKHSNDRITKYCTNVIINNLNQPPSNFPSLESVLKSI